MESRGSSYPDGYSVNDGIEDELSSVIYTSFNSVVHVDMVFKLEYRARLAKRDIKSAFRLLLIFPDDMKYDDNSIYIDTFLPMG